MDMPEPFVAPRTIQPPVHKRPSQSDLYLRDKESFLHDHPVKITLVEILKILTPAPCPDPDQFDLAMREIHE